MSIITCRITKNGYDMAADSISVRGYTQSKTAISKLFEVNGMVLGGCGAADELSLFGIFLLTHKPASTEEPAMLDLLSEFYDWKKKKTETGSINNQYLLGIFGKIFRISDWLITAVKDYEAIGAGMDYALAALYLGHTAKEAVETAIELSIYCESPVVVISRRNEG